MNDFSHPKNLLSGFKMMFKWSSEPDLKPYIGHVFIDVALHDSEEGPVLLMRSSHHLIIPMEEINEIRKLISAACTKLEMYIDGSGNAYNEKIDKLAEVYVHEKIKKGTIVAYSGDYFVPATERCTADGLMRIIASKKLYSDRPSIDAVIH